MLVVSAICAPSHRDKQKQQRGQAAARIENDNVSGDLHMARTENDDTSKDLHVARTENDDTSKDLHVRASKMTTCQRICMWLAPKACTR